MFIVSLTYVVPLSTVDQHLPAHREYLARNYAAGVFILSGRKEPREGGIILATIESRDRLQAVLAEDPFKINHVAEYEIVQFTPTQSSDALSQFVGT